MFKPLTHNEHAAVTSYAVTHGTDWKQQLAEDWQNGNCEGDLQRLRNTHGPTWLNSYSLADWPKSLFSSATALDAHPDCALAAEASRLLIHAYVKNPEQVDWSDIQDALAKALEAFDLPADYPAMAFAAAN